MNMKVVWIVLAGFALAWGALATDMPRVSTNDEVTLTVRRMVTPTPQNSSQPAVAAAKRPAAVAGVSLITSVYDNMPTKVRMTNENRDLLLRATLEPLAPSARMANLEIEYRSVQPGSEAIESIKTQVMLEMGKECVVGGSSGGHNAPYWTVRLDRSDDVKPAKP